MIRPPPRPTRPDTLFPYPTLSRSRLGAEPQSARPAADPGAGHDAVAARHAVRLRLSAALPARRCGLHARAGSHDSGAGPQDPLLPSKSAGTGTMTPLIELRDISKRFVKKPDLAEKLAGRLGIAAVEQVTPAVDPVDPTVAEGEVEIGRAHV